MLKLAGVSVRVEGVENLALDGAFIIVANHESWFDVWALAGCLPIDTRFVAKKELERVDQGGGPPDGALRGRDPMPGWGASPLQEGSVS